jgi:hypothetical protein
MVLRWRLDLIVVLISNSIPGTWEIKNAGDDRKIKMARKIQG